jgi:adenosylmethionine-8-amino-7-oxononanoate aminotransferase
MSDHIKTDRRHIWHPFTQEQTAPDPIEIVSGSGVKLYDADGHEYLDMISSWWVNIHGHAHPEIGKAIAEQAATLEQVIFAGFTHPQAINLSASISKLLPGDLNRVFFSDDGSTAVEVALKVALQYWQNLGQKRERFLTFEGGYHGDTVGAMSAGSASGFFDTFKQMLFKVDSLPYPQTWIDDEQVEEKEQAVLKQLDAYLQQHGHATAALIVEPLIQGAGGMRMCRPEFLRQLKQHLSSYGVILIFDEVMTGFGRTGKMFAANTANVTPDIICLSKGLSGGTLPISLTVCSDYIYEAFLADSFDKALSHGHSFTANPICCAAANASLRVFEQEQTLERLPQIEAVHFERMRRIQPHPRVKHARVCGTIAALDIVSEQSGYQAAIGQKLKPYFQQRGLLLRPLGNVLYLLPPYCVSDEQLHYVYDEIELVLDHLDEL